MTEEKIQDTLNYLHHSDDHTTWDFDRSSGDPWGGYTRNGYEITYNPSTNVYTWEDVFDDGFNTKYLGAVEISEAELIEKLRKINYTI